MRVTLTAADGTNVEIHQRGPYNPDIADDLCARATALLIAALEHPPIIIQGTDTAPTEPAAHHGQPSP